MISRFNSELCGGGIMAKARLACVVKVMAGTVAALLLLANSSIAAQQSAVPVTTVEVKKHVLEETLELTGDVCAFAEVTVYSKVSGVIEKLFVEVGMRIEKDDAIAVVEHKAETAKRAQLAAAVGVAEAQLVQAEAQLENARLEKQRAEKLSKDKSIADQRFDNIMAQYRIAAAGKDLAKANLAAAKKGLEQMDVRLSDYTIRAPISGVVSERFIDEGAMDNPQLPIVTIADTRVLKIESQVPEADVIKVRKGMEAEVAVDAYPQEKFLGKVEIVDPSLDEKTRTMGFEVYMRDANELLKPGMFARITLHVRTLDELALPIDCLLRRPGTGVYYAFIVEGGVAKKVMDIKTGMRKGNLIEIKTGLKEGDQVVVVGQGLLKTGTPVVVRNEKGQEVPAR